MEPTKIILGLLFGIAMLTSSISAAESTGLTAPNPAALDQHARLGITPAAAAAQVRLGTFENFLATRYNVAISPYSTPIANPELDRMRINALTAISQAHNDLRAHYVGQGRVSLPQVTTVPVTSQEVSRLSQMQRTISVPSNSSGQASGAPARNVNVQIESRFVQDVRTYGPQLAKVAGIAALFAAVIDSTAYLNCLSDQSNSPVCLNVFHANANFNNPTQFATHMALFMGGYSGTNWLMNRNGPSRMHPLFQRITAIFGGAILSSSVIGMSRSEHIGACIAEMVHQPQQPANAVALNQNSGRFSGPRCQMAMEEFATFTALQLAPKIVALATVVGGMYTAGRVGTVVLKGLQISPGGRGLQMVYSVGGIVMFMSAAQPLEAWLKAHASDVNRVYVGLDNPAVERSQADLISVMKRTKENAWKIDSADFVVSMARYSAGKLQWVLGKIASSTGLQEGFVAKTQGMTKMNAAAKEFFRNVMQLKYLEKYKRNGGALEGVPNNLNIEKMDTEIKFVESFINRWNLDRLVDLRGISQNSFSGLFPRARNNFEINHVIEYLVYQMACGHSADEKNLLVNRNLGWFGVDGSPYTLEVPRLSKDKSVKCTSSQTKRILSPEIKLFDEAFSNLHPRLNIDISTAENAQAVRELVIREFDKFWAEEVQAHIDQAVLHVVEVFNRNLTQRISAMLGSQSYYYCVPALERSSILSTRNSAPCAAQESFSFEGMRGLSESPLRSIFDDLKMYSSWLPDFTTSFLTMASTMNLNDEQKTKIAPLLGILTTRVPDFAAKLVVHQNAVTRMVTLLGQEGQIEEKQEQLKLITEQITELLNNHSIIVSETTKGLSTVAAIEDLQNKREVLNAFLGMRAMNSMIRDQIQLLQIQYGSIMPAGMAFR